MFNGALLDVNNLLAQVKRSEESRLSTEKALEKTRSENAHFKEKSSQQVATIKRLSNDLRDFKERLTNTNSELCNMDGKTRLYYGVMSEIYEKLLPIVAPPKPQTKEDDVEDVEMEDATENACVIKDIKESSSPIKSGESSKQEKPSVQTAVAEMKVKEEPKTSVPTVEITKPTVPVEKSEETVKKEIIEETSENKPAGSTESPTVTPVKTETSKTEESKIEEIKTEETKTEVSKIEEKTDDGGEVTSSPRTRSGNKEEKKTPGKK